MTEDAGRKLRLGTHIAQVLEECPDFAPDAAPAMRGLRALVVAGLIIDAAEDFNRITDVVEALKREHFGDVSAAAPLTLVDNLMGPHEWGYRDPVEGGFIKDDAPYEAGRLIAALSKEPGDE